MKPYWDLREDLNPFPPFSDMSTSDGDRDGASKEEEEESVRVASNQRGDGNNTVCLMGLKRAFTLFSKTRPKMEMKNGIRPKKKA